MTFSNPKNSSVEAQSTGSGFLINASWYGDLCNPTVLTTSGLGYVNVKLAPAVSVTVTGIAVLTVPNDAAIQFYGTKFYPSVVLNYASGRKLTMTTSSLMRIVVNAPTNIFSVTYINNAPLISALQSGTGSFSITFDNEATLAAVVVTVTVVRANTVTFTMVDSIAGTPTTSLRLLLGTVPSEYQQAKFSATLSLVNSGTTRNIDAYTLYTVYVKGTNLSAATICSTPTIANGRVLDVVGNSNGTVDVIASFSKLNSTRTTLQVNVAAPTSVTAITSYAVSNPTLLGGILPMQRPLSPMPRPLSFMPRPLLPMLLCLLPMLL